MLSKRTPSLSMGIAMPIRREFRALYPVHWGELSRRVRFQRAGGECERCGRPRGFEFRCLAATGAGSIQGGGPGAIAKVGRRAGRISSR
jgi:hypothetical protein